MSGLEDMSVRVWADTQEDIEYIIYWVLQFEQVNGVGCWQNGYGEVYFYADSVDQMKRIVDYAASWEGEKL